MNEVKIEFNSDGFKEILESAGVEAVVRSAAETIRTKAEANLNDPKSEGYTLTTWMGSYGGGRWIGSVTGADRRANEAEAEYKTLSGGVI